MQLSTMSCWLSVPKLLVIVLMTCGLAGCSDGHSMTVRKDEHEHDDHEHHDHAPKHKPHDYTDGLAELASRYTNLRLQAESDRSTHLAELIDIARWLPELAADSDMPEAEWNLVFEGSNELVALLKTIGNAEESAFEESFADVDSQWKHTLEKMPTLRTPTPPDQPSSEPLSRLTESQWKYHG